MLGRVKDVYGKFQKHRSLQEDRKLFIQLRGKWNEDTRPMEITLVGWPIDALLVPLLCPRSLLESKSG
jgi:hypothetical protein